MEIKRISIVSVKLVKESSLFTIIRSWSQYQRSPKSVRTYRHKNNDGYIQSRYRKGKGRSNSEVWKVPKYLTSKFDCGSDYAGL